MPVFRSKFEHCRSGKRISARVAHSVAALLLCVFCMTAGAASAAPVQGATDPVQSTTNPVQSTTNPVQSTTNPVQSTDYPIQSPAERGNAESQQASIIAATVPEESEKAAFPPRLGFGRLDGEFSKEDLRRRPLLYFRLWANKPLPLVPSFLFLLFISFVASEVMPARMEVSRQYYTNNYWKSLWTGLISCLLFTTLARALFASEIGVPLATVSLAALQFFVLIGVAISSTLIGQTILSVFGPKQSIAVKRPWFERLAAPLVGSLLMSLLLVIPPLGILPRIGIRLIMLLSFLGMGAWFRTEMGTKQLGGSSET